MVAGFMLHFAGLLLRGMAEHRCPITNLFEVHAFIGWALVLFYLLIGPAYRVSFLGAFTAPVVALVLVTGWLVPSHTLAVKPHSAWVEIHAAIGILACGAFALAAVVAAMDFVQDRQLKSHHPSPTFRLLPAVEQLDVIGVRLLILGFVLLTAGMIGGAVAEKLGQAWAWPKTIWAWATWLVYAALLAARTLGNWHGRRAAMATMVAFVFLLTTYWGLSWLVR